MRRRSAIGAAVLAFLFGQEGGSALLLSLMVSQAAAAPAVCSTCRQARLLLSDGSSGAELCVDTKEV